MNWARVPRSSSSATPAKTIAQPTTARATAMVFVDPISRKLKEELDTIARTDAPVLITGETGTGKEIAARYVHLNSARRSGPFLAVNCGALSESLVDAELFGHERGAFTGAITSEAGWFEAANGGTLLLDEIGDLPQRAQVKLLRVLQEREVVRVGSRQARPIDIRLIAATNVNLERAVEAKTFRQDLLYRLNVLTVKLAPLRKRKGDIAPLAEFFLNHYGARFGWPDASLSESALRKLLDYSWPGNIRELQNVIHNALLLAQDAEVTDVPLVETIAHEDDTIDFETNLRKTINEALARNERDVFKRVTKCAIICAFEREKANQVRAAEALGVTRNEFRTHLSHMGLIAQRKTAASPQKTTTEPRGATGLGVVRIGYQHFGTLAALHVLGSLDERLRPLGFRSRWSEFSSGPAILDAIGKGEIDFGVTGEAATVFALGTGVPFYYIGHEPPAPCDVGIVVTNRTIVSVDDLRGKRVAFSKWSNADHLLMSLLKGRGLSPTDIEPVYISPSLDLVAELEKGVIDAWAIWAPMLSIAGARHGARLLVDGVGQVQNRQFYVARRAFAIGYPNVVDALLSEVESVRDRRPVSLAPRVAETRGLNLDPAAAQRYFDSLEFQPRAMDENVISEQQEIADAYFSARHLPSRVLVSSAVWRSS